MSGLTTLAGNVFANSKPVLRADLDPRNMLNPVGNIEGQRQRWKAFKADWADLWQGPQAKPYSPPAAASSMKSAEAQAAEQQGRRRSIYGQQEPQPKSGKTLFGE